MLTKAGLIGGMEEQLKYDNSINGIKSFVLYNMKDIACEVLV